MASVRRASSRRLSTYSTVYNVSDCQKGGHYILPEKWLKNIHGTLTVLGLVIGQSNFNQFPYLCYKYGGEFIVAYLLCLFTTGIPIMLFEVTIGQFSSSGPFQSFDIMPAFRGVSISMFLIAASQASVYNIVVSKSLYYFGLSFRAELPWAKCGNWATPLCQTKLKSIDNITCIKDPTLTQYPNGTCYNTTSNTLYGISDRQLALRHHITPTLPAKDFLENEGFLRQDQCSTDSLRLDLTLCLFVAFLIQSSSLVAGLKRSIKLRYFAIIFPLIALVILFIFSFMQEGSEDGLTHFFRFDRRYFQNSSMWRDAFNQLLYSLSICVCAHASFSRRNNFHYNLVRQVFTVCIIDTLVSIYASITVFNFIGGFARNQSIAFDQVLKNSSDLLYIVYPQACVRFPWSSFWSAMFFAMTGIIALDSQIQNLNGLIVEVLEIFPSLETRVLHVTTGLCLSLFLMSLLMSFNTYKFMAILNDIDAGWIYSVIILSECCIIILYGPSRLVNDISVMGITNKRSFFYWRYLRWWFIICWCIVCPIATTINIITSFYKRLQVHKEFDTLSIILQILIVIPIFAILGYSFSNTEGSFINRLKSIKQSTTNWGPFLVKHRKLVNYVNDWDENPRFELYVDLVEDEDCNPQRLRNKVR